MLVVLRSVIIYGSQGRRSKNENKVIQICLNNDFKITLLHSVVLLIVLKANCGWVFVLLEGRRQILKTGNDSFLQAVSWKIEKIKY